MAEILPFSSLKTKFQKKVRKETNNPLNEMIAEAVVLKSNYFDKNDLVIGIAQKDGLKNFFYAYIADQLFTREALNVKMFQCATYISEILTWGGVEWMKYPEREEVALQDFIQDELYHKRSLWASDYALQGIEKKDPGQVENGAYICFLLCSAFTHRTEARIMTYKDWANIGSSLFYQHFLMKKETGLGDYMSYYFDFFVNVTKESLKQMKVKSVAEE